MQETQVRLLGREDPEEGNGSPLPYSCLENSTDRGAWLAAVHMVTESQTQLSTRWPRSKMEAGIIEDDNIFEEMD